MADLDEVFHRNTANLRNKIHLVLVRPELNRNVGACTRAIANMGLHGDYFIVGSPKIVDQDCRNVAKHAYARLDEIQFADSLKQIFDRHKTKRSLTLAATARSGSPSRPHPFWVREASIRAVAKLEADEIDSLFLVFGPEGDGLTNEEVDQCDWVVSIASDESYRSLNLAQAVMVFAHEINTVLVQKPKESGDLRPGQKSRLIQHLLQLAEEVGFLLPGDPFKMRPRLEGIFSHLPNHIVGVKTLHGLLDQTIRSVKAGRADYKGRFKALIENSAEPRR